MGRAAEYRPGWTAGLWPRGVRLSSLTYGAYRVRLGSLTYRIPADQEGIR
jgi:hypothetical protein